MFSRFFKKSPQDQRDHYRRAPGKKAALGVKLVTEAGEAIQGELIDVSAGGAAVLFDVGLGSELDLGAVRELRFSSLTKGSVRVQAEVRALPREGGDNRYGFQFVDPGALFQQLDGSFYKYFNRRRWPRAQPALDRAVQGELAFGEVALDVQVLDIARDGVSFLLPEDVAAQVAEDAPVEVTIQVPRTSARITFDAVVRHRTPGAGGLRFGCSLEPAAGHSKKDLAALHEFVQQRVDEMERYNSAFK